MSRAYSAGEWAFLKGVSYHQNPYTLLSLEHLEWSKGFNCLRSLALEETA